MRVLMLTHNRVGLSSFLRAHALGRHLVTFGHTVTVIAGRREAGLKFLETEMEGVRVIQMPDLFPTRLRHGGLSPFDWLGRWLYVNGHQYDLVHGFEPRPSVVWPALWLQRRRGIPFVADCADLWGGQGIMTVRRPLSRATLGRFDAFWEHTSRAKASAITAISTGLLADSLKHGHSPDLTRLVPVGADADHIKPLPMDAARAAFGLPPEAEVVMHTGFTTYDEQLLADTFVALAKLRPNAWLVLTGGELPLVTEIAKQAGVENRVKHLGFVPHALIGLALACGDVMVLPYTNRPLNAFRYPNRFGDYLSAGKPTVTNQTGDLGTTVEKEGVGVCAAETPQAIAQTLATLLDDLACRTQMGQRARQLAEGDFSWRARALTVDELYGRLVGG
jgi:glycosyltransferase involved in cell wall biosynthesis